MKCKQRFVPYFKYYSKYYIFNVLYASRAHQNPVPTCSCEILREISVTNVSLEKTKWYQKESRLLLIIHVFSHVWNYVCA